MTTSIDSIFIRDVSMSLHTTFRIGGPARFFMQATSADEVVAAVAVARTSGCAWRVIGEGSNLLADDGAIDKAIIAFIDTSSPRLTDDDHIVVSGGAPLHTLVRFCEHCSCAGLAKLIGIPGTVGGAIAGHAGAYGVTVAEGLESVRVMDREGTIATVRAKELSFDYRTSRLTHSGEIVLEATYRLPKSDRANITREIDDTLADRRTKHPDYLRWPTAGSYFKNLPPLPGEPRRLAAGKVLDEVDAKKLRVGDAGVWHQHANIVVNYGHATARDVKLLTETMAQRVHERFGIVLEPEVQYLI